MREGEGEGERGGGGRRWRLVRVGKWLDVSCGGLVRVGGVVEYVWGGGCGCKSGKGGREGEGEGDKGRKVATGWGVCVCDLNNGRETYRADPHMTVVNSRINKCRMLDRFNIHPGLEKVFLGDL